MNPIGSPKKMCYSPARKHYTYDSTVPGCGHPDGLAHREMVVRPHRTTGGRRRNGRRLDAWALVFRMADASSVVRTLCGADAAVSECAQPTRTGVVHVSGWAALRRSPRECPTERRDRHEWD